MFLVIIFYLTQVLQDTQIFASSPYCQDSCGKTPNTMCEYPEGGDANCKNFIRGLTKQQKDHVLTTHNQLRQKVALGKEPNQPSATNMMVLTWDDEGESIAQRWADQCQKSSEVKTKDSCRSKLNGEEGGQNLTVEQPEKMFKDLISYLTRRINNWFLQGELLGFQWREEYLFLQQTESYTQIVWASTKTVGCGLSYNNSECDSMYRFVCNYYPAGNVVKKMIYKKGLACSDCPKGTECSKQWPGLCTADESDMGGVLPPDAINTEASANIVYTSYLLLGIVLVLEKLWW